MVVLYRLSYKGDSHDPGTVPEMHFFVNTGNYDNRVGRYRPG